MILARVRATGYRKVRSHVFGIGADSKCLMPMLEGQKGTYFKEDPNMDRANTVIRQSQYAIGNLVQCSESTQ